MVRILCDIQFSARVLSIVFVLLGCIRPTLANRNVRPNILLILADDVGREVLECYGGSSYQTPNLNDLAKKGAKLNHCYAMPVCHPTRVTLMTGLYPRHLGNPKWGTFPARAEKRTFANLVKNAGYATAVAGKWQLSLLKDDRYQPRRLGFDQWSLFGWHEGPRYHEPLIYENGLVRSDTAGKYGPDIYLDFLIEFMRKNQRSRTPFLAFYSMALCHDVTNDLTEPVPHGPSGRYDNFGEMVVQMDNQIGRIMDFLESSGLDSETLILFTTDNGTPLRSKISAIDHQNQFIYEEINSEYEGVLVPGGKGKLTDWGTRVPMIAVWKGIIQPEQTWDDLVDLSDILPTLTELAGAEIPVEWSIDGHSFYDLLSGEGSSSRRWVYSEYRGKYFAKTRERKLYHNGKYFNTERDPFEQTSLDRSSLSAQAKEDLQILQQAMTDL